MPNTERDTLRLRLSLVADLLDAAMEFGPIEMTRMATLIVQEIRKDEAHWDKLMN